MPNGFDPVWMETVRIEIARDRLRLQNRQHEGEEGRGPKGNNRDSSPAPNDLSIIVWNRVQGRRQTHPDEVGVPVFTLDFLLCPLKAVFAEGFNDG